MNFLYFITLLLGTCSYTFSDTLTLKDGETIDDVQVTFRGSKAIVVYSDGSTKSFEEDKIKNLTPKPVSWAVKKAKPEEKEKAEKEEEERVENTLANYKEWISGGLGGNFGLGLSLISPTGLTMKYLFNDKLSFEASLGLGLESQSHHIHGVLLYNFMQLSQTPKINLYFGGGLVMNSQNDKVEGIEKLWKKDGRINAPGFRFPVGISLFVNESFELFGDLSLNMFLVGSNSVRLNAAIGGRYYF